MTPKKRQKKEQLIVLDLGCGDNKASREALEQFHGFNFEGKDVKIIGVDLHKTPSVDRLWDLAKKYPWPFESNSIDGIFSSHFIEHLDGPERIKFFNETHRIMKYGANVKMRLIHPYWSSVRAVQDPTHKWPPICSESYMYWDKQFREINKLGHYLGDCDFRYNIYSTWADPVYGQKPEIVRNDAAVHNINVIADLMVDMWKRTNEEYQQKMKEYRMQMEQARPA